ncbi:GNAT family N-acetyltransferase [Paenibacillus sp. CF384]|uniref:GNAT family N-acetyltransferase n=1 Tax=Paenibacillus sp. CF384 TaxID=1884382 RepID=UPI000894FC90|nr:GNAT family N-acetyltransferase [Paenibacillus sp. CF384]SDW07709.1 Protein N-acetyltransferase, RimJ/RimL family [Paenibacillus sp. CF384]
MITLVQADYTRVLPLLRNLAFIPVSAYSVINHTQSGIVFVDNEMDPTCSLIVNSYGVYFLAGSGDNELFMNEVIAYLLNPQNHPNYYDLYASTSDLLQPISDRLAGKTVLLHRSSFSFDLSKFHNLRNSLHKLPEQFVMRRMDGRLFDKYQHELDSSYQSLWGSSKDFMDHGFGYCIMKDDQFVSVCNAMFVGGGYADIDIVTVDDYQKQGLATLTGVSFIEHCLNYNLIPNYNCDAGNQRSIQLARKLGFIHNHDYPMLWWHQDQSIIDDYLTRFNYSNSATD